ncbi:MAG: hypothetical protein QF434_10660 [Nitrospinaceae bacterium]|jgi:hypothetical protein|nr:hypothetical protein [Nitrospinaceae bacterium]
MSDQSMDENWKKPYEEDGVTLGPEDALRREIEKSKVLKVEKLQLKDSLEKLQAENKVLARTNQSLEKKLNSLTDPSEADPPQDNFASQADKTLPGKWALFLLIFNITAVGILLVYLLKQ